MLSQGVAATLSHVHSIVSTVLLLSLYLDLFVPPFACLPECMKARLGESSASEPTSPDSRAKVTSTPFSIMCPEPALDVAPVQHIPVMLPLVPKSSSFPRLK